MSQNNLESRAVLPSCSQIIYSLVVVLGPIVYRRSFDPLLHRSNELSVHSVGVGGGSQPKQNELRVGLDEAIGISIIA